MITVNLQTNEALNTVNKSKCRVVFDHGNAYTNAAGIIALERDIYTSEQVANILYTRTHRKSKPFFNLVKPLDFNGEWLYLVSGWEQFRQTIIVRKVNTSL